MQTHLLQLLCLIAMEKPNTTSQDDIRFEKVVNERKSSLTGMLHMYTVKLSLPLCFQVKILRQISPIILENTVVGQYRGDPNGEGEARLGYVDDPAIPKDSLTPTYAMACLQINNERWDGEWVCISQMADSMHIEDTRVLNTQDFQHAV